MKLLDSDTTEWQEELATNLAFIKKHKRYPFTSMTIMPLITSIVLLGGLIWMFWAGLYGNKQATGSFPFIIALVLSVPVLVAIGRYFSLIGFRIIHTSFYLAENMKLLQLFLEQQKLVTFRHPAMPEVFQIISKNISAMGEDREVLIFVADDKRVLVNSHYTSSRKWFRFLSPPTHEKEMIKSFMHWLSARDRSGATDIVPKGFS
jgi:hypothetical protein